MVLVVCRSGVVLRCAAGDECVADVGRHGNAVGNLFPNHAIHWRSI